MSDILTRAFSKQTYFVDLNYLEKCLELLILSMTRLRLAIEIFLFLAIPYL